MITEGNIADYLFVKSQAFGVDVYQWGNIPKGAVKEERVTIQVKPLQRGKYWKNGFVEVNFCMPYIDETGKASLIRFEEVEKKSREMYDGVVDKVGDDWVRYEIDTLNRLKDEALRCYYLNVHIAFQVLNINK